MQPINIRFIFSYRDFLQPGLKLYVKRPIFWLLMLSSALCIALSFFLRDSELTLRLIGIIGIVVPLSVFMLSVIIHNRRLNNKEIIYAFSDKGIELQLPGDKQEYEWSSVTRLIEEKDHIMLFCSVQKAHIIPKRAFSSEEQKNAFYHLLKAKLPGLVNSGTFKNQPSE